MAVPAPIPDNEAERLAALASYDILDTPPEKEFDDVARLASHICNTPICMVSLIDANRQWFKANIGPVDATETSRDLAICGYTILSDELCVVPDTAADPRFFDNPFVTGDYPQVRFYAGAPLVTGTGIRLGSLCVIDTKARDLTQEQRESLSALGRQVVQLFELRRTSRRLQEALKAKEEFLRIASHDLKNPLTAILCGAYILQTEMAMGPIDQAGVDSLGPVVDGMLRQSSHMTALITGYLDHQAIEDGAITLEQNIENVAHTLNVAIGDMEHAATRKESTIRLVADESLPAVRMDASRISQALRNLIGNALKFSPPKSEVILKASTCRTLPRNLYIPRSPTGPVAGAKGEDTPLYLLVEVIDVGPGISEADAPKLFSKYAKLSAKSTGGESSSGLGLDICRTMIELHGGKIGVHNNKDAGSTFWFALPIFNEDNPPI
ncbi:MAG: ATP-binding protein [Candidatus Sumerlaeota bacterium]